MKMPLTVKMSLSTNMSLTINVPSIIEIPLHELWYHAFYFDNNAEYLKNCC